MKCKERFHRGPVVDPMECGSARSLLENYRTIVTQCIQITKSRDINRSRVLVPAPLIDPAIHA
jgi:hypothetical protein